MQYKKHNYDGADELLKKLFSHILKEIKKQQSPLRESGGVLKPKYLQKILSAYPRPEGYGLYSKDYLLGALELYKQSDDFSSADLHLLASVLQMKPVRTHSGVAPVTVLTKPFPCPGQCIFCPNDIRMPKSYLADEPGAQRAERNYFDPYLQTYNRLQALATIGHPIDKVELIVLGGTWSFYPEEYQVWFIQECFRALNEFGQSDGREKVSAYYREKYEKLQSTDSVVLSNQPAVNKIAVAQFQLDGEHLDKKYNQVVSELYIGPEAKAGFTQYQKSTWDELETQHKINETASCRCVGLVIETRPDAMSEAEVVRIRRLGCTKTQIGVQSLQDSVLHANRRGHGVAETRKAFQLLRQAGFKIHAHWMANLYGSDPERDIQDFDRLFSDPDFHPDELKVYPCSLIGSAQLMEYYKAGKWKPYTHSELLKVVSHCLAQTPEYCRLTRVIRDIPSTDIVDGNKLTNFREIAQKNVEKSQQKDIRSREIRRDLFDKEAIHFESVIYQTSTSQEVFLQALAPVITDAQEPTERLLAFLRLSLPKSTSFIDELKDSALIREVHVYGPAQKLGSSAKKRAQHGGLGTQLLELATEIAQKSGFKKMSVISAVGTREYYRSRGFSDGVLYQHKQL